MGLRASGDASTRKAIASRLGAANVAAGGSESDPTGSAALLKQGSETPLLPYALKAFGNPTVDYDSLIKEQLAKQQGDTTGTAIAKGAGRGVYSAVNAQTTPENLALLAGMGLAPESLLSKVAGAGFAAQAGEGAVESGREAFRKIGEGDLGGAAENIVGTGVNAAFATLGGMHAISEVRSGVRGAEPTPEPVTPPGMSPMSPETTPIDQPQAAPTERRLSTRKRVSQMTREELENSYVKDALTDQLTGLHNYRAFKEMHEDNPSPVGFSDVDGLKALNDTYGHAAGDALLKAKADALKQAGLEAYRKQGDEFLTRGATGDELRSKLDKANQILANSEVKFTDAEGKERTFKGAGFSYGVGDTEAEADAGMNNHKAKREGLGLRARGTLGTMKEVMPPEQAATPVPEPVKAEAKDQAQIPSVETPKADSTPTPETPKTPIEPIEDKLRRTIGSVIRTRQLKKAATDRLNVELGLRTVLQTKLPEDLHAEIDAAKGTKC
jgi:diguanylate cyclase (GGDEF)-like protein